MTFTITMPRATHSTVTLRLIPYCMATERAEVKLYRFSTAMETFVSRQSLNFLGM